MKVFNIGDFVKNIENNSIGFISKVVGKGIFEITLDDGKIQYAKKKNLVFLEQRESNIPKKSEKIYLGCIIENELTPLSKQINFYLINDTSFEISATNTFKDKNLELFTYKLNLPKKQYQLIYTCEYTLLNNSLRYIFTIQFGKEKDNNHLEKEKSFKIRHFEKIKSPLPLMDTMNGILFELSGTQLKEKEKITIEPHKINDLKRMRFVEKPKAKSLTKEIDIHFDKIIGNEKIDESLRLMFQINYLEKEIDDAIHDNLMQLIVIHGHGKGVLKSEVLKFAEKYPQIHSIKTLNTPKYKGGASEINFK